MRLRRIVILASQFGISETLSRDLREQQFKTVTIIHWLFFAAAIVKAKYLFVNVAIKMERLNGNIGYCNPRFSRDQKFSMPFVWTFPST